MATHTLYGAFFRNQIVSGLQKIKRWVFPEHTDEDPRELLTAFIRLLAYEGHRWSSMFAIVARGCSILLADTRASINSLLTLIGRPLVGNRPAVVDIVCQLSQAISAGTLVLPQYSKFSTKATFTAPEVLFEYTGDSLVLVDGTSHAYFKIYDDSGDAYTDFTNHAAADPIFNDSEAVGDCLYIGNTDLMFNGIAFTIDQYNTACTLSWEYYDEGYVMKPESNASSPLVDGITIRLELDNYFGVAFNRSGLEATVRYIPTGQTADVVTAYDTSNYVLTSTLLGADPTAALSASDFEVMINWVPWSTSSFTLVDDNLNFDALVTDNVMEMVSGAGAGYHFVKWLVPYNATQKWVKTTIDGVEAYWIRIRATVVVGGNDPDVYFVNNDGSEYTKWYFPATLYQGKTVQDVLGVATANKSQEFTFNNSGYIAGSISEMLIGSDDAWELVDNFFASDPDSKHFVMYESLTGDQTVLFGDGVNGMIPPAGSSVQATYRISAEQEGNTGSATVTKNWSNVPFLTNITNPRAASGWKEAEGATDESRDLLRIQGPQSIRVLSRAVTPADAEYLAVNEFTTEEGASPVARAIAIEEGFGIKTVAVYCIGAGGDYISTAVLDELDRYFNGRIVGIQRYGGVGMSNITYIPANYTKLTVAVTATIEIQEQHYSGAEAAITSALQAFLNPLAMESDGVTYKHVYQGKVSRFAIGKAILDAVDGITDMTLTLPASDVELAGNELPFYGAITLTVTAA